MQQRSSLGFTRITADDAQQQRARIALQFAEELATHPPAAVPQKLLQSVDPSESVMPLTR